MERETDVMTDTQKVHFSGTDDYKVTDFTLDKAELIARGKIHRGDKIGQFVYSLYDGKVSVIDVNGVITQDKAALKGFIRKKALEMVFPLAGADFISDLLKKEKKTIPMVNGFVQASMEIQPADILLQLCDVTGHEQVFTKEGRYFFVKPMENGYKIMQGGRTTALCRTYSDVIKLLGDDSRKVFDPGIIEREKRRVSKAAMMGGLFEGSLQNRTI